jgi:hypothetical protein
LQVSPRQILTLPLLQILLCKIRSKIYLPLRLQLSAQQKSAGAFQYREQGHSSDNESESSGLSDHEVPSPISSAGSLSPDKAFTLAYLQTAIRRSQKKMAAVMIQVGFGVL